MAKQQGGSKKKSRSTRQKGKYEAQRRRTTARGHRRAIRREKRQKYFVENPDAGTPQRKLRRAYFERRKARKKTLSR